jgi:hypothetical protein
MNSPLDFAGIAPEHRATATALLDRLDEITFDGSLDTWDDLSSRDPQRRHTTARWVAVVAAAACLAGVLVLVQGNSPSLPPLLAAPPAWAAVPTSASPEQTTAITAACQKFTSIMHNVGMPGVPAVLPHLAALDLRGTGATAFYQGNGNTIACMATKDVKPASQAQSSWLALSVDGFPVPTKPVGESAIVLDAIGTATTSYFDKSRSADLNTLAEYTTVTGRVPANTARVIVQLPKGPVATATLLDGQFAIWWPATFGEYYNVRFVAIDAQGKPLATLIETSPWWSGYAPNIAPTPTSKS